MKIFIVGSLNMDLTVKAPFLPEAGQTVAGSDFLTGAGGKGANQAVAVGKLGGSAYMVGCVGNAFGDELIASLKEGGVHTDYVRRRETVSSGVAVITVIDGDNRIIVDKGANGEIDRALVDEALSSAKEGDYLIAQLEIDPQIVLYAFRAAKEKGLITVLNPAPAAAIDGELFALSDYFIPNQTEAEFYTGIYPDGEKSAARCIEALQKKGVQNVIVTLGSAGSFGLCGGTYARADIYKVKTVDTTAAGDTYIGAFVTRLSEGADAQESMRFASRASALTVTKRGAQRAIPLRSEVDAL